MSYALHVLDISNIRGFFYSKLPEVNDRYHINTEIYAVESLYDYCILLSIKRIMNVEYLNQSNLFLENDLFTIIYDDMFKVMEYSLYRILSDLNFQIFKNQKIKAMVTGNTVILAKGEM